MRSFPNELDNDVREQLTFVGCGGSGRLLVRIDGEIALSRFQLRRCRKRMFAWDAPASAGATVTSSWR